MSGREPGTRRTTPIRGWSTSQSKASAASSASTVLQVKLSRSACRTVAGTGSVAIGSCRADASATRERGDHQQLAAAFWAKDAEPAEVVLAALAEARELAAAVGDAKIGMEAHGWRISLLGTLARSSADSPRWPRTHRHALLTT